VINPVQSQVFLYSQNETLIYMMTVQTQLRVRIFLMLSDKYKALWICSSYSEGCEECHMGFDAVLLGRSPSTSLRNSVNFYQTVRQNIPKDIALSAT
jgi:hypothetical protein